MKDKFVWSLISAVGIFCLGAGVTVIHGFHNLFVQQQLEHLAAGLTGRHSWPQQYVLHMIVVLAYKRNNVLFMQLLALQHITVHCCNDGIHHLVFCTFARAVYSCIKQQAQHHSCHHQSARWGSCPVMHLSWHLTSCVVFADSVADDQPFLSSATLCLMACMHVCFIWCWCLVAGAAHMLPGLWCGLLTVPLQAFAYKQILAVPLAVVLQEEAGL